MAGVLILAEALDGALSPTAIELAGVGRKLADELGQPLQAVVLASEFAGLPEALGKLGVEEVLLCEDVAASAVSSEWALAALEAAAKQTGAGIVLVAHSELGRELAPLLAFKLDSGAVTDATAVRLEGDRAVFTKPVFGGSALSEQVVTTSPQVASLRPRTFEAGAASGRTPSVSQLTVSAPGRVEVLEEIREEASSGPKLKDAKIVVAGGRGLGNAENWKYMDELAQVLGAAVGASRAVTDAGWAPHNLQVGLTGVAVAPDLYITVGISGAVQHVSGISGAKNVVAINKDPEANIFRVARYGVVGDWKAILPAFTERLRELRS